MIEISKPEDIDIAIRYIAREGQASIESGRRYYVSCSYDKPESDMTGKQRGALHVWCKQFAEALNNAGHLRKKVMMGGDIVDVDWSMEAFKEDVYKVMLHALTGKNSTEKQNTVNPSEVANHVNRHIGQTYGVTVGWPSKR